MNMIVDDALKKEWFAVLRSEDVLQDPVQVVVMGERIVVFRTSRGIHAFKDLCIHRGSALSLGKVVDDTLRCPYHAWRYNCEGQCVHIPAQPAGASIPKKAAAQVYGCQEKYGLVWVSFGNSPEAFPAFAQFRQPGYASYCAGPYKVRASAPRIVENFLDYSHLMWVHEGVLGDSSRSEIDDYRVHREDERLISDEVTIYEYADIGTSRQLVPNVYVKEARRPLVGYLKKRINSGDSELASMIVATPIDREMTLVYLLIVQNFDLALDEKQMLETTEVVMQQDIEILENQRPEELPLDLTAELSLKSDRMSVAYRQWLRELGVKWGTA